MMRRYLFTLLCALAVVPALQAQNRIDEAVEQHATLGSSRFTSAVERDPKTRAVQKVVRILETRNDGKLVRLFKEEMKSDKYEKTVQTSKNYPRQTLVLTAEGKRQVRIYMLDHDPTAHGQSGNIKVTIIIKNK